MGAAIDRAARDGLARGLPAGLAESAVGVELGQHLQSAITTEMGEGTTPAQVLDALQNACNEPIAYAVLLELLLAASLDELQVLTGLPARALSAGRQSCHRRRPGARRSAGANRPPHCQRQDR